MHPLIGKAVRQLRGSGGNSAFTQLWGDTSYGVYYRYTSYGYYDRRYGEDLSEFYAETDKQKDAKRYCTKSWQNWLYKNMTEDPDQVLTDAQIKEQIAKLEKACKKNMLSGFIIIGAGVITLGWFCIFISVRMRKKSHEAEATVEQHMDRYEAGEFDDLSDSSEEEP